MSGSPLQYVCLGKLPDGVNCGASRGETMGSTLNATKVRGKAAAEQSKRRGLLLAFVFVALTGLLATAWYFYISGRPAEGRHDIEQLFVQHLPWMVAATISLIVLTALAVALLWRQQTEKRQFEDQLRLQSEALRVAANAIIITDRAGSIQWVNPGFERLTGYSAAEVIGRTPRVLRSGKQPPAFFASMWEVILRGEVWRGELVNKRKDGTLYDEEMTITPVQNTQGEVTHFIAIKLDISERKRSEQALAETRDLLEKLVADRTAQLMEVNGNLQTFTHTAAHDLRSPLRAISSFASLGLDEYGPALDEMGRSYLQRIRQAADQMDRLLTDLLEYSQLAQTEMKLQPVSVQASATQAISLLEKRSDAVQIESTASRVIAHPATLTLILLNLISNGLKFVPEGRQPEVRLGAEEHNGYVRIYVRDNGIGIDEAGRTKLFQVFQRLHGKHAYPGTGLGLAIVRKGAERMGGRVGLESEPGKGSCFWVELKSAGAHA